MAACPERAIRVTAEHLYVDWRKCDGCMDCTGACSSGAIEALPGLTLATGPDAPKVLVGSRAEAKELRKRAEEDARRRQQEKVKSQRDAGRRVRAETREAGLTADGVAAWTLGDAAIVLGLLLVLLAVKDAVFESTWVPLLPDGARIALHVGVLVAFYAAQLAALVWVSRRHGLRLAPAFGLGSLSRSWVHRLVSVVLIVLLAVATRAATTLYGAAAQSAGWAPPLRATSDFAELFGRGGLGFVLALALVAGVGPFVEELVFRGVCMSALGRWGGLAAVLGSSALFAGYHLTPWWLVPTFLLGAALGWLTWSRRGLWPAIVLHVLYNAMAVVAAYWVAS